MLAVIFVALVVYRDMNRFVVRHYEIHSDKIAKDVTFCLLSDLHEKTYGENNSELVEAIEKEDPDIVLIAGDMITGQNSTHKTNMKPAVMLIRRLAERFPVYAANGNHEYKMFILGGKYEKVYRRYARALQRSGVVLLRNTGTYLEDLNMEIHGLETGYEYYSKIIKTKMEPEYMNGFFGEPCADRYQLLIAHNPRYFDEYCTWGADLVVSGHVHGGIARLPLLGGVLSPALIPFPKYDGGLFKKDGRYMVLSRGLGMHTVPVRFNNPGEVCIIKLVRDEKQ